MNISIHPTGVNSNPNSGKEMMMTTTTSAEVKPWQLEKGSYQILGAILEGSYVTKSPSRGNTPGCLTRPNKVTKEDCSGGGGGGDGFCFL